MNRRRIAGAVLAVAAVTVLGVTLASGMQRASGDTTPAATGPVTQARTGAAPPLRGRTLTGARFDLTTLRGKVVLVNVWASWCDPCRQELPVLAGAQRRWSADGLEIAGIDIRDNAESAHRLLTELGVQDLRSVADPQGTAAVAWGARGVPETFVVDRAGQLRWWAQGAVDAAWLEQRIPPLLAAS
ncbi:TlpA family protein disulfide reductase [Pseudosporangium ferrugineum]|uniref:Cytochrome c biogenesis protein CcmG/thiol:disulfide interchange protein DsbE n=1 Tax=Pseudosporangium ferrugineum TaxID=439699 RepID=A0A2T0RGC9_9ACTN|nr:TlpA disulfide reductase family protein [Pseudosporangium ferrugineum]PRY20181.1 cytochrome c biogenesis protein CcmG/thiol:disulfide interchange protein DsbE [Pseudosporangium ferrugineum]